MGTRSGSVPGRAELSLIRPDNRKASQKMNWVNPGITFHGELEELAINPQYLNTAAQQLKSRDTGHDQDHGEAWWSLLHLGWGRSGGHHADGAATRRVRRRF